MLKSTVRSVPVQSLVLDEVDASDRCSRGEAKTQELTLSLEVDSALFERVQSLCDLLEQAPEFVRKCLLDRHPGLLSRIANLDVSFAAIAGDGVFLARLSPAGDQELRAATACAAHCTKFCIHGCPFQKVV